MIEGVLIFIGGLIGGYLARHFLFPATPQEQTKKQYDKYKNPDGLYSSKAVKGDK
jgi:hypothetical protein